MTTEHWTDCYKDAPAMSLEHRIYLAACYISGGTEEHVRRVGQIAFDQNVCIWHAGWVANGSRGLCDCNHAGCKQARKKAGRTR